MVSFKRFKQLWQQLALSTTTGILKVNYVITKLQKSFEAAEYSVQIAVSQTVLSLTGLYWQRYSESLVFCHLRLCFLPQILISQQLLD